MQFQAVDPSTLAQDDELSDSLSGVEDVGRDGYKRVFASRILNDLLSPA